MRRISTMQLLPGMIAAEDVFSYADQLLIANGTALTDGTIAQLDMHDIVSIKIEDAPKKPLTVQKPEPVSDHTRPNLSLPYSVRLKSSAQFRKFKAQYNNGIEHLKYCIDQVIERNAPLDVDELYTNAVSILSPGMTTYSVLDMLQNMREYDDSIFAHSLNVALICNVLARWLRMKEEEIQFATACGLLHDAGKVFVPKTILQKAGKLSDQEYAIVKQHPASGYQLLLDKHVDKKICNAALMHHERCDGTGYPFNLKAPQIDPLAKIVAIADTYDAMTAARVYRGPISPFKVIELFEEDGLQKYEPKYIMTFLQNVVDTYISNRCRLSDGQEGNIIFINRNNLARPMVQCGRNYINLAAQMDLHIECLL